MTVVNSINTCLLKSLAEPGGKKLNHLVINWGHKILLLLLGFVDVFVFACSCFHNFWGIATYGDMLQKKNSTKHKLNIALEN